jgi:hypothetical protein
MCWTTGVRFPIDAGTFFFPTASRPALGPNHPPIQRVPGGSSRGIKRLGRENHSTPISTEINDVWNCIYTPSCLVHAQFWCAPLRNTNIAQGNVQWLHFVNTVMKLGCPWKVENFLTNWATVSFSRRTPLREGCVNRCLEREFLKHPHDVGRLRNQINTCNLFSKQINLT